jgi:hypothetical protein
VVGRGALQWVSHTLTYYFLVEHANRLNLLDCYPLFLCAHGFTVSARPILHLYGVSAPSSVA